MVWKLPSVNRRDLIRLRCKAFRRHVWFKALNGMERGLVDLVIRVVDKIRSKVLARVLLLIVKKLSSALESRLSRMTREVGQLLAQKVSFIARSWGNEAAETWKNDEEFIKYLTVIAMNTPSVFKL